MKISGNISQFLGKVLLCILLLMTNVRSGAMTDQNEYPVKAMFLLNFIKYVEWPIEKSKPIVRIGVAGESEMFEALTTLAAKRSSDGQQVEVVKVNESNANSFQIIFVSKNEKKTEATIRKLSGKGVLIISEDDKCQTKLSGINLFNKGNKIRFEINILQVKNNGMKISSKLIELASAVNH